MREDISQIRSLSPGGLFIEMRRPTVVEVGTQLEFLAQQGQTNNDAGVRHAHPGGGVGLKFIAVSEKDRSYLAAFFNRLRHAS